MSVSVSMLMAVCLQFCKRVFPTHVWHAICPSVPVTRTDQYTHTHDTNTHIHNHKKDRHTNTITRQSITHTNTHAHTQTHTHTHTLEHTRISTHAHAHTHTHTHTNTDSHAHTRLRGNMLTDTTYTLTGGCAHTNTGLLYAASADVSACDETQAEEEV